jgi:glycosyltransferase involved in cell wall biosynthesis
MSGTVVVNEDMVELFRSRLRSPRSVVAVHNYPELRQITQTDGYVDREPVAIYVGSLSKGRGLEVLLQAGELLKRAYPEARLQVFGPLEFAGVREDYTSVDRWQTYGVEYRGVVDHREVSRWLRRASVGLIPWLSTPNHVKGTPVKLFEYMLAGLPVVVSDFGVMGRIVRETGCGLLVAPGDPDALSGAVEALLKDPVKAARMGEMGRRAVLEKYNWASEEKKLLALYEELVGHA